MMEGTELVARGEEKDKESVRRGEEAEIDKEQHLIGESRK